MQGSSNRVDNSQKISATFTGAVPQTTNGSPFSTTEKLDLANESATFFSVEWKPESEQSRFICKVARSD